MQIWFVVMYLERAIFWVAAIAAVVGAIMVLFTRDDAFSAADRHPKLAWAGILAGCAVVCALYPSSSVLGWAGVVITGIYWFDVRPQLQRLIGGYGW